MASRGGWPRSTCARTAASSSITPDSSSSTTCVRTRCTWKVVTPAPTRTASRKGVRMTSEMTTSAMLIGLGAFHGINQGMGWLFTVALGMQERRLGAVWRALIPLTLGHALAIAATVLVAVAAGAALPVASLRLPVAATLGALGVYRLIRHRHFSGGGMRVGMGGLTTWSFLMATCHGAGLMVLPVFLGMTAPVHGASCHAAGTVSANAT